jgi:hypothetical protein
MEEKRIPTTSRQAFKILDDMITPEERAEFLAQTKSEFTGYQHFGLGAWIRNNWIYGPEEEESAEERELRDACYRMLSGMKDGDLHFQHPDMVSGNFLGRYYDHLKWQKPH